MQIKTCSFTDQKITTKPAWKNIKPGKIYSVSFALIGYQMGIQCWKKINKAPSHGNC
jgi:hypothetical protein